MHLSFEQFSEDGNSSMFNLTYSANFCDRKMWFKLDVESSFLKVFHLIQYLEATDVYSDIEKSKPSTYETL